MVKEAGKNVNVIRKVVNTELSKIIREKFNVKIGTVIKSVMQNIKKYDQNDTYTMRTKYSESIKEDLLEKFYLGNLLYKSLTSLLILVEGSNQFLTDLLPPLHELRIFMKRVGK